MDKQLLIALERLTSAIHQLTAEIRTLGHDGRATREAVNQIRARVFGVPQ